LLLLTGVWAAERSGRDALAGTLLGLAVAIKLFPCFLFLHLVLARRWKVIWSGLVSLLAVVGLTAAVLGPSSYTDYFREVLPRVAAFRANWDNASLAGFWIKLFDPPAAAAPATTPQADEPAVPDETVLTEGMPVFPTVPLYRSQLLAWLG